MTVSQASQGEDAGVHQPPLPQFWKFKSYWENVFLALPPNLGHFSPYTFKAAPQSMCQ